MHHVTCRSFYWRTASMVGTAAAKVIKICLLVALFAAAYGMSDLFKMTDYSDQYYDTREFAFSVRNSNSTKNRLGHNEGVQAPSEGLATRYYDYANNMTHTLPRLDFAIPGFPKCGTSTLMYYLHHHPEIHMFPRERCEMTSNDPSPLLHDLAHINKNGSKWPLTGIKCPRELESGAIPKHYSKHYGTADPPKLLVGIRHPVLWFESFYNHRVRNGNAMHPDPNAFIGKCRRRMHGVCTNRAAFHAYLASLMGQKDGISNGFMPHFYEHVSTGEPYRGSVFLYEIKQLNDRNISRATLFRNDLQNFLGLRQELPSMIWFRPGRQDEDIGAVVPEMDICATANNRLRGALMEHATNASKWIRMYLLGRGVTVSSRNYFENLVDGWLVDTCNSPRKETTNNKTAQCTNFGCFLEM